VEGSCTSSAVGFNIVAPNISGMEGNEPIIGQMKVEGMPIQPNPIEKLYNMHQNYFAFV
jgi:hypothetical protein